jgi:hypothetical protein
MISSFSGSRDGAARLNLLQSLPAAGELSVIDSRVAVQTKGFGSSFQAGRDAAIADLKSATLFDFPEDVRYCECATVARVNPRLKDEFGERSVRVRGNSKAMCHVRSGIVALAADQILRRIA